MNPIRRCALTAVLFLILVPSRVLGATVQTIIDEPLGARDSLGLTLWHLGHSAQYIQQFHQFLKQQNLQPQNLIASSKLIPPRDLYHFVLDPELLPSEQQGGWKAEGEYLTSGAGDAGPTVSFPLHVLRSGLYRLWVRYYGWPTGTAVMNVKVYRTLHESDGPVLNDEVYDYAVEKEGPTWKEVLVDLEAGYYSVKISHVTRWWHAGDGPKQYLPRKIDCLYLTDAIWTDAPTEEALKNLRVTAKLEGIQRTIVTPLLAESRDAWKWWQVRPLSWEEATSNSKLFQLSRAFWRQQVDQFATRDYGEKAPDYRVPERQVIFDDEWNLVANPVRIRRQIEALQSDIRKTPTEHRYYWLEAGSFEKVKGNWWHEGTSICGWYGDYGDVAETNLTMNQEGRYTVWVRFGLLNGYFAPWRLTVREPGGSEIRFDHDQQTYPSEWQKVGVLEMKKAGDLHFAISALGYRNPGTYRRIHDFLVTTDPDYVPQGSVRPPITKEQYLDRAKTLGAISKYPYFLWMTGNTYESLSQEAWPKEPVTQTAPTKTLVMASDTVRAIQVGLRSLSASPVILNVRCGELRGRRSFTDKVNWRVVGFVPYGDSRQQWSPFCLMRRPTVTIPPFNLATVWLTVDSQGVAAGDYIGTVEISGKGIPSQIITLKIHVSPVKIVPQQPMLVGGWTPPPEGEIYLRDYTKHGMNMWYSAITKEEMRHRGFRLLALQQWSTNESILREQITKLKQGGLDYSDYIFPILDEPCGKDETQLKPFLDIAKAIRQVDSKVQICFNPGESATLATFKTLDPWCDFWIPYRIHLVYPPSELEAKRTLFTAKPWMWYETPCLWDKNPALPQQLYDQIRSVPGQSGKCVGTGFFAFYYPFRDPWDTAYEYLPDAQVTVLPSRHGPVATRTWEAIREGIQHADLAMMVKERAVAKASDPTIKKLLEQGSVEELVGWLENNR